MSSEYDSSWLDELELSGTAKSFASFCKKDLIRRSNTEEDFDADTYTDAIKLVLRKLGALEMDQMQ